MALWIVNDTEPHARHVRKTCKMIICCSDANKCAMTVVPTSDDICHIISPLGIDEYTVVVTEAGDTPLERRCILQYERTLERN